ncbi:MAG: hypothetical protein H0T42_26630 [Deltaproteobacteria bacterium]|nr:hypothetical protein [Deltaproteobacteria bacterium]
MSSAIRNFHLPLPAGLYTELREAAAAAGQPATKLAQALVKRGLEERRRSLRRRDVAAYAQAAGGTNDDLDATLEAAGLDALRDLDR